jgi:hypothetical protein
LEVFLSNGSSMANNTKTIKDQTPVVDVDVVSSDTNPEAEAPAKDEDTTTAKPDDKAVKTELDKQRTENLDQLKADHAQALESNGHYKDWGFVYAAPAPIANAIGGEIGFMQRDDKTMTVQRTGIGIYLRSDHIFSAKLDACTERF